MYINKVATKHNIPDVHETKATDVGRVCVCDEPYDLLLSQFKSEQFVQQTESTRHDAPGSYASHLQTPYHTLNSTANFILFDQNHTVNV